MIGDHAARARSRSIPLSNRLPFSFNPLKTTTPKLVQLGSKTLPEHWHFPPESQKMYMSVSQYMDRKCHCGDRFWKSPKPRERGRRCLPRKDVSRLRLEEVWGACARMLRLDPWRARHLAATSTTTSACHLPDPAGVISIFIDVLSSNYPSSLFISSSKLILC